MSDLERNPSEDRAALLRDCRCLLDAGHELVDLAQSRAHPGPIRLPAGRELVTELREEIADVANYAPWALRAGELDTDQVAEIGTLVAGIWRILSPASTSA